MSEKRILIVGAGGIGLKHIRAFGALESRPRLFAIDPRPESRARAEELGVQPLDASWEALDLSDFDGVVICAPAPMHVPYAVRCLTEGVPVLSEKPLSHAWDGVEDLLSIAERGDVPPSGVGYVRRYHPAHESARNYLASGELGKMLEVRIVAGQPFTTYRPDYREIYYAKREMGGGCLLDCASHMIDLVQYYMGSLADMRGFIRHLALEGVEVEDTAALSLDFESGALGSIHINQFQPLNETQIDFCGVDGVLRIIEPGFRCRIWRKGATDWEDLPVAEGDYLYAMQKQAESFINAIDGGPALRTTLAEAALTLKLCLRLLDGDQ